MILATKQGFVRSEQTLDMLDLPDHKTNLHTPQSYPIKPSHNAYSRKSRYIPLQVSYMLYFSIQNMNDLTPRRLRKLSHKQNLVDLHKARCQSVRMVWNSRIKNLEGKFQNQEELDYVNAMAEAHPKNNNIEEYLNRELLELNQTEDKLLEKCYERRRVLCTLIETLRKNRKKIVPKGEKGKETQRRPITQHKPRQEDFDPIHHTQTQSNVIGIFRKDKSDKVESKSPQRIQRQRSARAIGSLSGKKIGNFQNQKSQCRTPTLSAFQTEETPSPKPHNSPFRQPLTYHPTFQTQRISLYSSTQSLSTSRKLQSQTNNASTFVGSQDFQTDNYSIETPNWMTNSENDFDDIQVSNEFVYLLSETVHVERHLEELRFSTGWEEVRRFFELEQKRTITMSGFIVKIVELLKGEWNSRMAKAENIALRMFKGANSLKTDYLLKFFAAENRIATGPFKRANIKDLLKQTLSAFLELFYFQDSLRSHSSKHSHKIFAILDNLQQGKQFSPTALSYYLYEVLGSKISSSSLSLFLTLRIPQKPSGNFQKSKFMIWLIDDETNT